MHPYSFWRNFRNYNFISRASPTPQRSSLGSRSSGEGEDGDEDSSSAAAWSLVASAAGLRLWGRGSQGCGERG